MKYPEILCGYNNIENEKIYKLYKFNVPRILELTSEISYSDDSLKVSRLNEKVADICVNLEFFEVAIDFYKRALAIAEKNTSDTKRTSRLCYSIAQTYEVSVKSIYFCLF